MSGPLLDAARAALDAATGRPLAEALIRDLPDTIDPRRYRRDFRMRDRTGRGVQLLTALVPCSPPGGSVPSPGTGVR
jgi:hypothetical protein